MKYVILVLICALGISCRDSKELLTADAIVNLAIENTCQGLCEKTTIEFDFRGRHYKSHRLGGKFQLERITTDRTGIVRDVWNNSGFLRYINDSIVSLPDSMAVKYQNSVNSVHYFAQLPFGLNDPAVQKKLLGNSEIKGEPYYKIQITFAQDGGGKDFEDVFIYWIHQEFFTVDYFGYEYQTDGGGIRFREAYNPRVVGGIRFVDYHNYKPKQDHVNLLQLEALFQEGELELLSKIESENINVNLEEELPF